MFEICKRHTPMFALSDIKQISQLITRTLGFNNLNLEKFEINLRSISQTVRINEVNKFIITSKKSLSEVKNILSQNPALITLKETPPQVLLQELIVNLKREIAIDSYIQLGEGNILPIVENILDKATPASKKPLIIFTSDTSIDLNQVLPWINDDCLGLWLNNNINTNMNEVEAYFAINPSLKMEVTLNRFEDLENYSYFSIGMIRF